MRNFALATTTALSLLATGALANFDIYHVNNGWDYFAFKVFDLEPSESQCENIITDLTIAHFLPYMKDASSRSGARCKGDGCGDGGNPEDIEELEMNFGKSGAHVTLYKNRGWSLVDTDDRQVGTCEPDNSHSLDCGDKKELEKRFYCKSDELYLDNIYDL